jgi:thiamine biosynthesis lipoprotein
MTTISWPAWGTTVSVQTLDPAALPSARRLVERCLRAGEKVADREHPRSEVARLARSGGRPVRVSGLLADLLQAALAGAAASDGLCDPTVGNVTGKTHRRAGGPDAAAPLRPVSLVPVCGAAPVTAARPEVRGWHSLQVDEHRLHLPSCTELDVSATARAFIASGAATYVARQCGTGVLVDLGGAVATGGPSPLGGWRIPGTGSLQLTAGRSMVTSHGRGVVDPRTGRGAVRVWHSVTVLADSCVTAAALAVGGQVLGEQAPRWLVDRGAMARLVDLEGSVITLDGARQLAPAS